MNDAFGLTEVALAWHGPMRPARRLALWASFLGLLLGAILYARQGTTTARLSAVVVLGVFLAGVIGGRWWRNRRSRSTTHEAIDCVRHVDPTLGDELGRAIDLVDLAQATSERVSVELAQLHLKRVVARVPLSIIDERATRRASKIRLVAQVGILIGLVVSLVVPERVFEGVDVLFARRNVAPLAMRLLDLELTTVTPPVYLHESSVDVEFEGTTAQPQGSVVIVRGMPRRTNRRLVLTDGTGEVPFVDDGHGGLSARYVLEQSAFLRVAARFGDVLVYQPTGLAVESIVDRVPTIELEGAPKRVAIGELTEVELHYRVTDDHGIRQIELSLKSGSREERRPLLRLEGAPRQHNGVYVLDTNDGFVTGHYGAIELRIVARDDNVRDGGGWGQSAAITLDKPALGQAQVRRHLQYLRLRDRLVDWRASLDAIPRAASELELTSKTALALLTETAQLDPAGTGRRKALRAFFRAQHDKLLRAKSTEPKLRTLLADVILAVDVAAEAIAQRDAEHVARLLSDVAVEIESGAKAALLGEQRDPQVARVKAAHATLNAGAQELAQLGQLGADLGEITQAGGLRIGSLIAQNDFENVQRAASFLAERLRRPKSSFIGGGRAGVESGMSSRSNGSGQKASEADTHLERVTSELVHLTREHAAEIEAVERIVGDSEKGLGSDELKSAAAQHADALRRLVSALPSLGGEPGSARASLGLVKELVRGAADSLAQLNLLSSFEDLRKADAALAETDRLREAMANAGDVPGPKEMRELRDQLSQHRDWIKRLLDETRERALNQVRDLLRQAGSRERELGERLNRLTQRESKNDAVLPDDMRAELEQAARLMQQASEQLDNGRGRPALEQQRRAQSLIERNEPDAPSPEPSASGTARDRVAERGSPGSGPVVSTSDAESREQFRRRVQRGLSQEVAPNLSPAVRRYAEGLLK